MARSPTRERGPDNPNLWGIGPRFSGYFLGIPITIGIGYDNELWCYLTYEEADILDVSPGVITLASTPTQCVRWVQINVPEGDDKRILLEYYARLSSTVWWNLHGEEVLRQAEARDEEQRENGRRYLASLEASLATIQMLEWFNSDVPELPEVSTGKKG